MLLVAYPNQDQDTEFEFVYQVVPQVLPVDPIPTPFLEEIDSIYYQQIAIISLFVVLVLISVFIFCMCKRKTNALNKVENRRLTLQAKPADEESANDTSQKASKLDVMVFDEGQTGNRSTPQIDLTKKHLKDTVNFSKDESTIWSNPILLI